MAGSSTWATSKIHLHLWLRAIAFTTPWVGVLYLPGELADPEGAPSPLLAVIAFMAICMWPLALAAHWVEGGDDGLRLVYWPVLSRTIPLTRIASVEYWPSAAPWKSPGIGLRLASGGVLALANRTGPSFGIRTTDGRSHSVVLADDEELAHVRAWISRVRPELDVSAEECQ
ncbi:hypothetical protein Sked_06740 [Sanguibacter keddieii DSM 10542]|uniref:Bacterial Pleckstrin homology domain-containing protein n=1 Tax=Sanguibacter keddieii (strain ATCC 51767 / DSM 10542 / NCFB 3025 / ST-74) TaxID=446469 RepID=D1BB68_SANKS|nr:hypothetical protein [Sanguibacter keddieii]ACZ20634.1 hypothetical protein Sked_06740 [Sanguibacter keddieii DSM 10542]